MSEAAALEGLEQDRGGGLVATGVRFLRAFAVHAGRTGVLGAVLVCASALLENVGLVLLIPFLSVAMDEVAPGGWMARLAAPLFQFFHAETRLSRLSILLGLFATLLLLRAAANMARGRVLARLRVGFVEGRRAHLLRTLAKTPWERVLRLKHARVTQVINGDMMQLGAASYVALEGAVAALMLASQCAAAFLIAPAFAGISLALLAVTALAARPLLRRGYALGASMSSDNLALNHALGQFLGGLKLAIGQNLQAGFVAEFERAIADLSRRQTQFLLQQANSQIALSTLSGCVACVCALIGLGALDMPAPVVFTLLLILSRIGGPAQAIIRGAQHFAHSLPAFERVRELEADLGAAAVRDEPAVPLDPDGTIDFRGVTFLHGATGGVRDLTLSIGRGEIIGVTGPSGAGKTTFADLLVGLIAPQSGAIRVGATPLSGGSLTAWRGAVAYVAQDPFLFHDSIRRNLLWANPAAGEADLWAALERVGAAELARRAPEGLDAIVGERGALLSGGERQRIALARALLRKPRLLVLDEATSAMDLASEQIALNGLSTLDPTPTIVIIAHRSESLRPCDRVLRLDGGRLASACGS